MKKIIINSLIVFSLGTGGLAFAQSVPVAHPSASDRQNLVSQARQDWQKLNEERKAALEQARSDFQSKLQTLNQQFQAKRKAEQADLQARLQKIKDVKKQETVQRLDSRFTEINQKMSNHWLDVLNRLDDLLNRISSRADKAQANGQDVIAVRTAITKAKAAIDSARTAVQAQLVKTYPIQFGNDSQLKGGVSDARNALNNDLKSVRDLVQAARQAVVDALTMLKGVPDVDKEPAEATSTEATSSGSNR